MCKKQFKKIFNFFPYILHLFALLYSYFTHSLISDLLWYATAALSEIAKNFNWKVFENKNEQIRMLNRKIL